MNKRYRRTIIAGNWKMNKLPSEVGPFVAALSAALPASLGRCSVALCVPATHLAALAAASDGRVGVGAQNVSHLPCGAHTGEIAGEMLADLGVRWCIVGHSERRADNGETDETVNAKLRLLLQQGIIPILCVGEDLSQRERGLTMEHIAYQVKAALSGLSAKEAAKCVVAYEPIWAIGTGKTATAAQAQEVCGAIRALLRTLYGAVTARRVSILYGGSMNAANCAELLSQPDIDGGLIGGASLKSADFAAIALAGCETED